MLWKQAVLVFFIVFICPVGFAWLLHARSKKGKSRNERKIAYFNPKPDITTYELALIVKMLIHEPQGTDLEKAIAFASPSVARHLSFREDA